MPHFDDEEWELDYDLRTLEQAEKIKSDPKRMQQLENHIESKRSDLNEVEDFLFGGEPKDLSAEESEDNPKKGKSK